jgi:hypothetical protein
MVQSGHHADPQIIQEQSSSIVAAVGHLAKLLPHLDRLLAHKLNGRDVAVGRGLDKLGIKVLILKAAVLLDVVNGGGVVQLLNSRPVACAHAHWARLAGGVDHAASQVRRAQSHRSGADCVDLSMPGIAGEQESAVMRTSSSNCGKCGGGDGSGYQAPRLQPGLSALTRMTPPSAPGGVVAAHDVVVSLAHNLAVLHDDGTKAATCKERPLASAMRGVPMRGAAWHTQHDQRRHASRARRLARLTCALLQPRNLRQLNGALHEACMRSHDARGVGLVHMLAAALQVTAG